MPIGDRIDSIHALPKPLLSSEAHGMDLSSLAFLSVRALA